MKPGSNKHHYCWGEVEEVRAADINIIPQFSDVPWLTLSITMIDQPDHWACDHHSHLHFVLMQNFFVHLLLKCSGENSVCLNLLVIEHLLWLSMVLDVYSVNVCMVHLHMPNS